MIVKPPVHGSRCGECRQCSYLRRMEINSLVHGKSAPSAARWRLRHVQHVGAAHRQ